MEQGKHYIVAKLDPSKILGSSNKRRKEISPTVPLQVRWEYRQSGLRSSGSDTEKMVPSHTPQDLAEDQSSQHSKTRELICKVWRENDAPCAVIPENILDSKYARHIPHNRIHSVLKEMNLASDEPKKQHKKKWIRYERQYSNSLWHWTGSTSKKKDGSVRPWMTHPDL